MSASTWGPSTRHDVCLASPPHLPTLQLKGLLDSRSSVNALSSALRSSSSFAPAFAVSPRLTTSDDGRLSASTSIPALLKIASKVVAKRPNPLLLVEAQKFVKDGSLKKFGEQLDAIASDVDVGMDVSVVEVSDLGRDALLGVKGEQADVLVNAMQLVSCLL
jgi:hypothetical protein